MALSDRQLRHREMEKLGIRSGKSYRRYLKKRKPVTQQFYKDGRPVPTKRPIKESE